MKVLVCGSRSIDDDFVVLDELRNSPFEPDTVVHGDARGVDQVAYTWASMNDADVETHPVPEWAWERIGKRSGPMRNAYMVEQADAVVAIWDGESSGTKDTLKKAEAEGLPVQKVTCDVDDGSAEVVDRSFSEGEQSMLTEFES